MSTHRSLHLTSRPLNNTKVFIFDFDGTICDSFMAALSAINDQAEAFNYRKVQLSDCEKMRDWTVQEVLKSVGISNLKLPFVVRKIRKELNKEMGSLRPFKEMREALFALREKGYGIGVLTSNSEENVLQFSKKNNLEVFDFIYSGSSIFGKDRLIKKLLKKLDISVKNAIYVGDEMRDIAAARAVGIPIVAVTWGFNSRKILETLHPDYLIDSVCELKKF